MNKDQLLKKLSCALSKSNAIKIAQDKTCLPSNLIDLSFDPEKEIAFRASWVLEQFLYYRLDDLLQSLPEFIAGYHLQKNQSCQRHFTKIMMFIVDFCLKRWVEEVFVIISDSYWFLLLLCSYFWNNLCLKCAKGNYFRSWQTCTNLPLSSVAQTTAVEDANSILCS